MDARAVRAGVDGVENNQARIVDPTVGIFESEAIARLQGLPGGIAGEVERFGRRQDATTTEMVVEEQAETEQPARPEALVVRQHETKRPDDVRGCLEQHLALGERFVHQTKLVIFEIAQAAVNELGRGRGGRAGEVALVAKENRKPAPGRVAGDPATVDAAADDGEVVGLPGQSPSRRRRAVPSPLPIKPQLFLFRMNYKRKRN